MDRKYMDLRQFFVIFSNATLSPLLRSGKFVSIQMRLNTS